jgi:nicotinamidase/pyrazinamidase
MEAISVDAVVAVDIQADFTELYQGSLAVPGTDRGYVDAVIAATTALKAQGLRIVATMDDHPADHVSFFTSHPGKQAFEVVLLGDVEQTLWPPHCVRGTPGAAFVLPEGLFHHVVHTGTRKEYDSYSGFRDDGGLETDLAETLEKLGAKKLLIYGLATDFCVKATVLHALERGFRVVLDVKLSRGITPESTAAAVQEMLEAGAEIRG